MASYGGAAIIVFIFITCGRAWLEVNWYTRDQDVKFKVILMTDGLETVAGLECSAVI